MWTLVLSKQVNKFISDLQPRYKLAVENAFEQLSLDPYSGKALVGELRGYFSYRVGTYRIIYSVEGNKLIIQILRIHHRKEVYEKLRRI